MASSVVIKVKFEDTLRRFNVHVNGDQHLDLNMEGLRLKICSLLNLPLSANFTLTYRDEDNDLVTLADDEDLHDVVKQGLNPVRISVSLKTDKDSEAFATSSGTSMPRGSLSPSSDQNIDPKVAEVLKSVPEPLHHAFAKISTELTSKAASTSPVLADILDGLSKMGQSYLNASHSGCGPANVGSHAEACDDPKQNTPKGKVDASIGGGVKHNDVQTPCSVQKSAKSTQATSETKSIRTSLSPSPSHKGKNVISEPSSHKLSSKKNKEVVEINTGLSGVDEHTVKCSKGNVKRRVSSEKDASKSNLGDNMGSPYGRVFSSNFVSECPFTSFPIPPVLPPIESFSKVDGMGCMFHKGVRCDGCGVLPIIGPRFKSKVKHDYDLCSICFGRMGNFLEYTRIDFPLPSRHPLWIQDIKDPVCKPFQAPQFLWASRRPATKHLRSKLDSRFIMDVNVMDGTLMAPLTPFTKIWRMRNNGTLPWHCGLQLLWIGGDRFSASDSVEIEMPVNGVDAGKEIEIAVDFVAPELPGQYISYWRLAEPSGPKFGQRVWVLIQVDASVDLTHESSPVLNLNLPPETTGDPNPQVLDVNEHELNVIAGDFGTPLMAEQRRKVEIEDLNFPINNDLLVSSDVLYPTSAAASSSVAPSFGADSEVCTEASPTSDPNVASHGNHKLPSAPPAASYPIIDISDGLTATSSSPKNDDRNLEQASEKNVVEETLLKELEEMGFKQIDLNKEVLRINKYDLEQSLDNLCCVTEWDPILEELKEMGFEDKDTNKKLLAKNNGSITRVVMDLIAGEKPDLKT